MSFIKRCCLTLLCNLSLKKLVEIFCLRKAFLVLFTEEFAQSQDAAINASSNSQIGVRQRLREVCSTNGPFTSISNLNLNRFCIEKHVKITLFFKHVQQHLWPSNPSPHFHTDEGKRLAHPTTRSEACIPLLRRESGGESNGSLQ